MIKKLPGFWGSVFLCGRHYVHVKALLYTKIPILILVSPQQDSYFPNFMYNMGNLHKICPFFRSANCLNTVSTDLRVISHFQ